MFPITIINLRVREISPNLLEIKANKSDKPFKLQKNYQIPVDLFLNTKMKCGSCLLGRECAVKVAKSEVKHPSVPSEVTKPTANQIKRTKKVV